MLSMKLYNKGKCLYFPLANFQPGVRYNISLYSCSSEMLQRWQGYMQELGKDSAAVLEFSLSEVGLTSIIIYNPFYLLSFSPSYLPPFSPFSILLPLFLTASKVPSSSVSHLSISQQDSDALVTWGEIPLVSRRGYLLGYNIYISNGSQLLLLGKCLGVHFPV